MAFTHTMCYQQPCGLFRLAGRAGALWHIHFLYTYRADLFIVISSSSTNRLIVGGPRLYVVDYSPDINDTISSSFRSSHSLRDRIHVTAYIPFWYR
jgi:hypothetical protein